MNARFGLYCASVIALLLLSHAASAVIVSSSWSDDDFFGAHGSGSGGATQSTASAEADPDDYSCWGSAEGGEDYYTTVAGEFTCSISFDGYVWALLNPGTSSGYGYAFAEGNADFPGIWRDGYFHISAYDEEGTGDSDSWNHPGGDGTGWVEAYDGISCRNTAYAQAVVTHYGTARAFAYAYAKADASMY